MSSSQSQPAAAAAASASATSDSSNPVATTGNTGTIMKMNGTNNNNTNGQVDKKKSMPSMNMAAAAVARAAAAGGNNSTKLQGGGTTTTTTTTTTPPKSKQRHRNSIKSQSPPPSRPSQFNDDDEDDDNLLHHQYSSSSFASTLAISGGSATDNDTAYITEIARRSVARAALHLGIEGMEGIALDTLGSVLLGYLEMVGTTISTNVEISGRSSAHVNAYDALNAITECTAPAAMQLGIGGGNLSSDLSLISTAGPSQQPPLPLQEQQHQLHQRGWEGLASFLFGPEWFSIRLAGEEEFEMKKEDDDGSTAAKNGSHAIVAGAARGEGADGGKIGLSNGSAVASSSSSSSAPPKKAGGGKTFLPNRPTTLPPISEEKTSTTSAQPPPKSGKGKQLLPNMMGNEKTVTFSIDRQNSLGGDGKIDLTASSGGDNNALSSTDASLAGRWHAPYLHHVPSFPLVKNTKDIANPHRLPGSKITLSLHDYTTEMEACVDYAPVKRPTKRGGGGGGGSVVAVVDDHERKRKATELRDEMAERAMRAALRIPDDVYSTMGTVWGSMRKEDGSSSIPTSSSINKNVKSQSIMSAAAAATAVFKEKLNNSSKPIPSPLKTSVDEKPDSNTTIPMPSYVPNFLPPYPTHHSADSKKHDTLSVSLATASSVMGNIVSRLREKKRKLSIDIKPVDNSNEIKKAGVSTRDAVRRSVIGLGKPVGPSYWGSTWLDVDDDGRRNSSGANKPIASESISNTGKILSDMSVEQKTSSLSSTTAMAAASKKSDGTVAPLSRASGSRLTKILEGSMNLS